MGYISGINKELVAVGLKYYGTSVEEPDICS